MLPIEEFLEYKLVVFYLLAPYLSIFLRLIMLFGANPMSKLWLTKFYFSKIVALVKVFCTVFFFGDMFLYGIAGEWSADSKFCTRLTGSCIDAFFCLNDFLS